MLKPEPNLKSDAPEMLPIWLPNCACASSRMKNCCCAGACCCCCCCCCGCCACCCCIMLLTSLNILSPLPPIPLPCPKKPSSITGVMALGLSIMVTSSLPMFLLVAGKVVSYMFISSAMDLWPSMGRPKSRLLSPWFCWL
uniref:Uncharacterized protein n=1 Tax=Triticum urartu TaxID=4572 RepID=A0A8R7V9Q0_TRIUA